MNFIRMLSGNSFSSQSPNVEGHKEYSWNISKGKRPYPIEDLRRMVDPIQTVKGSENRLIR